MSLLPFVVDQLLPSNGHHHFGLGIYPGNLVVTPHERSLLRSLANLEDKGLRASFGVMDGIEQKSHIGKDGFQVSLDVRHFAPNEITVKTVDHSIVVEAKHEERQDDHGYISRQFTRRYELPKEFNVDDVVSTISSDGILTVKAPPLQAAIKGNVRHVEIQHTGPARLSVKPNEDKKAAEDKKAVGEKPKPK